MNHDPYKNQNITYKSTHFPGTHIFKKHKKHRKMERSMHSSIGFVSYGETSLSEFKPKLKYLT